jgi:hypothetical protein
VPLIGSLGRVVKRSNKMPHTHTGASDVIRSQSAEVDRGAALDEDAYYYYNSTGHTQWEDLVQTEEHLLQKRR